MKNMFFLLLLLASSISCQTKHTGYKPASELHKMAENEIIDYLLKYRQTPENTVFHDSTGRLLTRPMLDSLHAIEKDKWWPDWYGNAKGELVEMVLRTKTPADDELVKHINAALTKQMNQSPPLEIVDVDCASAKELLAEAFKTDQAVREDGGDMQAVDRANQQTVVSIIKKCGFPDGSAIGKEAVEAAFFVIQHADLGLQEQYFPKFQESADKGYLDKGALALMEDRILMREGKKQKYGTQLTKKDDGAWEVHPIEDPEHVNERRAAVGLGPIEDYLAKFGVKW